MEHYDTYEYERNKLREKLIQHTENLLQRKIKRLREKKKEEMYKIIKNNEMSYEQKNNYTEYNIENYIRYFGTALSQADLKYKRDIRKNQRASEKFDLKFLASITKKRRAFLLNIQQ